VESAHGFVPPTVHFGLNMGFIQILGNTFSQFLLFNTIAKILGSFYIQKL